MHQITLWRRLLAEFLGTALLVTAVVGSGIMAATLSPDDIGLRCWRTRSRPRSPSAR